MVAVQKPSRSVPEYDPLDTISRGLQIASQVYGIKDAMDKNELLKQKASEESQGLLSQEKLLQYGKDYNFSSEQKPGSLAFKVKGDGGGLNSIFATPKPKEVDPLVEAIRRQTYESNIKKSDPGRFENLPKDKQLQIDKLSSSMGHSKTINNMMTALEAQLDDPNISEAQKVASVNEQLKIMNAALGADALGEGETARVSKFLTNEPSPTVGKWSYGPDLKGFTEQVKNAIKRNKQSIEMSQRQIDELYGRSPSVTPQNEELAALLAEKERRQKGANSKIPKGKGP